MKRLTTIVIALMLAGCSTHIVKQILTPELQRFSNAGGLQYDCTSKGLFIFEGFPDIVRSEQATKNLTLSKISKVSVSRGDGVVPGHCFQTGS